MTEKSASSADLSWSAFDSGMRKILNVSKAEILRREAEYRKMADANPKKRGPKKKTVAPA